jgi:hypothetical protein
VSMAGISHHSNLPATPGGVLRQLHGPLWGVDPQGAVSFSVQRDASCNPGPSAGVPVSCVADLAQVVSEGTFPLHCGRQFRGARRSLTPLATHNVGLTTSTLLSNM